MPKWPRPIRHAVARLNDLVQSGSDYDFLGKAQTNSVPAPPQNSSEDGRARPDGRIFGASGTPIMSGYITDMQEYNPEMRGRNAFPIYEEMRRTDADVAGVLLACKLPIRSAQYQVVPGVKPNEPGFADAQEIAEFVEDCLFSGLEYQNSDGVAFSQRFESVIENALLCMDFGCSGHEDLWRIDGDRIRLRKIAPRLPLTFHQFNVDPDGETLQSVVQWGYRGSQWVRTAVPASKFTLFSLNQEGANFYGRSILRPAYPHWFMKQGLYRIDSIACERNGMGVPVITMGENPDVESRNMATEWTEKLSANEATSLTLPFGWDFKLVGVTGAAKDLLPSIQHQSEMICRSSLAMFMSLGSSQTGSRALGNVMVDFFQIAEEAVGKFVCDTINETTIRRLVDFNYQRGGKDPIAYPKLVIPNIAVLNPLDIMTALKEAGDARVDFLQPDDETENWLRKRIGMPMKSNEGGRPRFSPVSDRIQSDESGTPQEIESGKGTVKKPAPAIKQADPKKKADLNPEKAELREKLERRQKWHGLDISIETDKGSTRSGVNAKGEAWSVTMQHPYGYIRMTAGNDGDHVDCYVGPDPTAENVYVVHQNHEESGAYDEDKCLLDFPSEADAKACYMAHHSAAEKVFGSIDTFTVEDFIDKVLATKDNPGAVQLSERVTRELLPHEHKHDFDGHWERQDKTQNQIRRILGGALPGLIRNVASRAAVLNPEHLETLSFPVDRALLARIANAIDLAYGYGKKQVYAERYRATRRPASEKPQRALLSTEPSAEQDQPGLIAKTTIADVYNGITSRIKAAHVDAYKKGERDAGLTQSIIDALDEMSDAYLDRASLEAARSAVVGGRWAAFEELESEIGSYVWTSAMDQNTCAPCQELDGTEWTNRDDIDVSPGDTCDGGDACRCQILPIFADEGTVQLE